jgi:arginine deiminase
MADRSAPSQLSAYGGDGWRPRERSLEHGVTLRPRKILTAAKNPNTQTFLENLGVECVTVNVDELGKAAGAIGCLTGILEREHG